MALVKHNGGGDILNNACLRNGSWLSTQVMYPHDFLDRLNLPLCITATANHQVWCLETRHYGRNREKHSVPIKYAL